MRILIFGTGRISNQAMQGINDAGYNIEIIAFVDNDEQKQGQLFWGKKVIHPGQIHNFLYDYICIMINDINDEVYNQLVYGYHIEKSRVVNKNFLLQSIMKEKYSEDPNREVKDTLLYWSKNKLTFLNQYQFTNVQYDEIFWDVNTNMPYTWYAGKKMFYPRKYPFKIINDKMYAESYREMEQHQLSPHRYLKDGIQIKQGDIVIDAGAREGDFALPYIDTIGKLYIFECDFEWVQALKMTYRDYGEKVVIIPKMLSDYTSDDTTTLYDSVKESKIDFLKMDIEGAEVKALCSAKDILRNNKMRCSICCYHRKDDRKQITKILESTGYQCSTSNGHVVFVDDPNIFRDADFRKGIVYAIKI